MRLVLELGKTYEIVIPTTFTSRMLKLAGTKRKVRLYANGGPDGEVFAAIDQGFNPMPMKLSPRPIGIFCDVNADGTGVEWYVTQPDKENTDGPTDTPGT